MRIALLAAWALLAACGDPAKDDTAAYRYHPEGWDDPSEHGTAAKYQDLVCTSCHGADLTGGTGTSCDSCHTDGWRTDCTFCHGGEADTTGAPPVDIDGSDTDLSFPEHTVHVATTTHPDWSCAACHSKPEDVLSAGHLFVGDHTPGEAEVAFEESLAVDATYAAGTCSNVYCHGNGAGTNGTITSGTVLDCGGCHGDAADASTLSGSHAGHVGAGLSCADCHTTASGSDGIATPEAHVDGDVDVDLPAEITRDGDTCSGTCHGADHDGAGWTDGSWHPAGWEAPDVHGLAAKLGEQRCADCHGEDLAGGTSGTSCDTCHAAGWRTDCTYCHGGTADTTGAPPADIDGSETGLTFPEHTTHVTAGDHAAWTCDQCHVSPTDVLSAGHVFIGDTTPATAEVELTAGLSPAGAWSGGTCSNLYCHGDGASTLGTVTTGASADCGSCHGSAAAPGTLSTVHAGHLGAGATCEECHGDTATNSDTIADPDLHVDGAVETAFGSGMVYSGGTCTGTCHSVDHDGADWAGGTWHPAGWDASAEHGIAANLQDQDCTTCHGADLTGGTSGTSCDSCHTSGWRTDCTYCHGGTVDTTGAPPEDIDDATTGLTFEGHTEHVTRTDHPAWDCDTCHETPGDVLDSGHVVIGDSTAGVAEVDLSGGLSSAGVWSGGTCSNLYCHGDGDGSLGSVTDGDAMDCGSCHGDSVSYSSLSGQHSRHIRRHATCDECHDTAASDTAIADPDQHVDGTVQWTMPSGISYSGGECYGVCHGEEHYDHESW